ncbi:MAG: translation initiation factor IF-6 [Candidatus ainarchaeum sp.]|nr:translation initiation factor IF-6 [Candidatus ainarchaeum sp.]
MELVRRTVHGSPYVGVFCCINDKIGLLPHGTHPKETKGLRELFGIEIIETKLAESPLLGVVAAGNSNGLVVGEIVSEKELDNLKRLGLRVKRLSGISAIGNLLEANDTKGICSPVIKEKTRREIADFLKIELKEGKIAGSDLIGSCLVATNRGFAMNANASEKEFDDAKKFFGLEGSLSTANYGDAFLGNCIAANSRAAMAGINTTGIELMKIDEGLGGE